jgi:cytochrome b subunit of formate dehydrogenase
VCHENLDLTRKHKTLYSEAVTAFRSSVHGRTTIGGIYSAASCSDCHSNAGTTHAILAANNPASSVNHSNIPKTCGRCHGGVAQDFWDGIHGQLMLDGRVDVPVCTDCHGEHGIVSHDDPRSPVSPARLAEATCEPCHESARLNAKYGLPDSPVRTHVDSYHGLKSKAGDLTVANCSSCHGSHRILPAADQTSSINKDNLVETCGACHHGITADVAQTPIHAEPGVSRTPAAEVVKNIYLALIFLTIGGMLLHWLIDFRKEIKKANQGPHIKRMTTGEVWQHHLLAISFISLVLSGFALRYSDAFWAEWLFGWDGGFAFRGLLHRASAVVMTVTAVWHAIYLTTARGRQFFWDMIPTTDDWRHLIQLNMYNLGLRKEKPKFGRFIYIEKVEYWGLIWGTIVMVLTGVVLWLDNEATRWVSQGFLDVVLVIHFYEAWLATLVILVWHMYSTVFNPGVYPMNPAWYSGKMPVALYEHEHAADPALPDLRREALAEAPAQAQIRSAIEEEESPEDT